MNLLQKHEASYQEHLLSKNPVPAFRFGDTVRVHVKVKEGDKERVQIFEGLVIARNNNGVRSTFRVRKIASGEGAERVFSLYSPSIRIELARKGAVRRAKLYYLRGLSGKKARIAEYIQKK